MRAPYGRAAEVAHALERIDGVDHVPPVREGLGRRVGCEAASETSLDGLRARHARLPTPEAWRRQVRESERAQARVERARQWDWHRLRGYEFKGGARGRAVAPKRRRSRRI